ncbi:CHAT domain-containing protein [uncultured Kordia sp.]|uniref:CHAT domain-containing protein n=1 Tax=uncultured Kordia sp. TaxID=507699 RepID=UPI0026087916|nr:CHAT domain-containing protein [uncultured Kordia sp.]
MLSIRALLLINCLCFVLVANAQNTLSFQIESVQQLEDIELKTEGFKKILQQQDTSVYTEDLGMLYYELGTCFYKQEVYDKAFPFFNKSLIVRSQFKDFNKYNESRFWLSRTYTKIGEIEKAHTILIEIINDLEGDKYTSHAYRFLSRNAKKRGDIPLALYYLNLGLANKKLCENPKYESNLRFDIINTYAKKYASIYTINDTNIDLKIISDHQKLIRVDSLAEFNRVVLNNGLAVVYDAFKDFDRALYFYKKAEKGFIEIDYLYKALKVVNNIGIIYSKQKKYELATASYKRVLNESDDKEQIATALDNMGYYLNSDIAKEKIPYSEKAVYTILGKDTAQPFKLPTLNEIKESEYEQDILIYLIDLVDHYIHAYKQEQTLEYLHKAKKTIQIIDQLVSLIRYEMNTEASKLFWINKGVNIYMLAVEVCYLLNDPTSAFYYMEKNKALLLQENIKTLRAKFKMNVPKDLITREHQLYYKMLTLEEQFHQNTDDEVWKAKYTATNREFQQFMDSMQQAYPEYIKTKQEIAITSLENTIAKYTDKNESFVEYILHEADGYGIYCDSGEPIFFKIDNISRFHKKLEKLKSFMTRHWLNEEELKEYQEIGNTVFKELFPFENAATRLQNKKLTIVADQALQYLPFEILPTQKEGELIESYLVNSTETSYLQSFSLFDQIQQKQNLPTQKLLTIAPQEFQDTKLPTLTGTENIIKLVETFDESLVLTKQEASKANFLKQQNNFEIIHFNTHAGLDSITQKPWISFYEDKMTLNELFGIENQADLVILDACQTNDGINISGEGVINLSRGFFYNGTQSVMASFWKVNEQAGNELLQMFYHELIQGNTKSKALQLAKKEYLQKHQFSQNTPYYWAAFTLTGSTNAIKIQTTSYTLYIVSGIILLIILGIYMAYKKKMFLLRN